MKYYPLIVLLIAAIVVAAFYRNRNPRNKSATATENSEPVVPVVSSTPDTPQAFGYKCCWLAIRTNNSSSVLRALNLKDQQPANWASGIAQAYELKRVFVAPPVGDWIFVVGLSLPDSGDDHRPDLCTPLLKRLSAELGEVQYFGTMRVVGYHAWAKAEAGKIVRAYAYSEDLGTNIWNTGELTTEEKELGLIFNGDKTPDEEDVMKLAGKWSVNPQTLEKINTKGPGVIGEL